MADAVRAATLADVVIRTRVRAEMDRYSNRLAASLIEDRHREAAADRARAGVRAAPHHPVSIKRLVVAASVAALISVSVGLGTVAAADRSTGPVFQLWDGEVVGWSSLVRTSAGISATVHTTALPAGQAVTLWFVVFNNPSACGGPACGLADLLFNLDAEGDFLIGGGHVTGNADGVTIAGALRAGDVRGSAFPEIGMPDRPIGLTNPLGAQVSVLLHSHGPAATGTTLEAQISSFTGGCTVFLGDLELPGSGIADDAGDMPDALGECSTVQGSVYR
jgi:hypothetical protein